MKILYAGSLRPGSLTESRRRALVDLGFDVVPFNTFAYAPQNSRIGTKVHMHLLFGPGIASLNQDLVNIANREKPDLLFMDMGVHLWPKTVRMLRDLCKSMVHYTSEYFGFRRYLYRHFMKTVSLYDAHVITNTLIEPELKMRGAASIVRTEFGYDPLIHRPVRLATEEESKLASDAVFVGHWEPAYENKIAALRNVGIAVRVFGPGWHKARRFEDRRSIYPVVMDEYAKALCASKLCLGFLSKWNHNQSTSRTFEIPAVGGFLLADRTNDHCAYFEEGLEAEFFSSNEELVTKAVYYLAHDAQREQIAQTGHTRCLSSGYTHKDRVAQLLEKLG
jgi:spore maturation protein CgeB